MSRYGGAAGYPGLTEPARGRQHNGRDDYGIPGGLLLKRRRALPPGPRGVPLIGNALEFRRDPLGFLTRAARDHGDIVRLTAGRQELVFINHPALLESVLATNARRFTRSKSKPPTRLDYILAGGENVYRVINFPGDEDFWVRERHRFNPRSRAARWRATVPHGAHGRTACLDLA